MSLYETLCKLSEHPQKIIDGGMTDNLFFDLENKEIKSRGMSILRTGKITLESGETMILPRELLSEEEKRDPWMKLQNLYDQFHSSLPWGNCRKSYFLPKRSDELTAKELSDGIPRSEARIKLEAYILLGSLSGIFDWPCDSHWFWKGKNGLIVYRNWMEVKS